MNTTRMMEEIIDLFEIPKNGQKVNLKDYLNKDLVERKEILTKLKKQEEYS